MEEEKKVNEVDNQKDDDKKGGKKAHGLKTPKGTRDYEPLQMAIREKVFDQIKTCFKRHGAVTIETPVFELKEILTGKYGEDSKLIYDLQDQGGELCSLRYDLTVPFARYVAMNRIKQIKRYQIGRVYRRDNPVMNKGRFREFYQCDFDIAGEYDEMVPDSEALKLMSEILDELNVGEYKIKLNHRKLLDGVFAICGVPEDKFRSICSAVDKLDKTPWSEVRDEMIKIKGLEPAVADKIETYVKLQGEPKTLMKKIREEKLCDSNKDAMLALDQLSLLFDYLECYQMLDKVLFDFSLARGLDYYTGVIYEAILVGKEVGSVCAGGRYDELIGIFGNMKIPSVGFSVGVERIFTIMEQRAKETNQTRETETEVFVASIDKNSIKERMTLVNQLWKAGIKAELLPRVSPKIQSQLNYANTSQIPFALIFGENELKSNTLVLKDLSNGNQETIPRADMISIIKTKLSSPRPVTTTATTDNNNKKKEEGGKKGEAKQEGGKGKGGSSNNNNNTKPTELPMDISRVDIRVGKIVKVKKHEGADSLYVEEIDVGEEKPRQVVSGLVNFVPIEQMQDRELLVVCNLKPANLKGVRSEAMVLAASNADHTKVELVDPPKGSKIGERVIVEGFTGVPDVQLNPKHRVFETVQPDMKTNDKLEATYKGVPFKTSAGVCTVKSITNGGIK